MHSAVRFWFSVACAFAAFHTCAIADDQPPSGMFRLVLDATKQSNDAKVSVTITPDRDSLGQPVGEPNTSTFVVRITPGDEGAIHCTAQLTGPEGEYRETSCKLDQDALEIRIQGETKGELLFEFPSFRSQDEPWIGRGKMKHPFLPVKADIGEAQLSAWTE